MVTNRDLVIVVGGIASALTAARLRAAASSCSLILAAAPFVPNAAKSGVTCLDLTAHIGDVGVVELIFAVLRNSPPGGIVLVHEYQLRETVFVKILRHLNLAVIALNTHSCYDYYPNWLVGNLERDAELAQVEYFAIDVFTCVTSSSWETFLTTRSDEFQAADLEEICKDFPVILSADFTPENICVIASFPGVRGILITCDELKPILPPERHRVTVDAAVELLAVLAAQQK